MFSPKTCCGYLKPAGGDATRREAKLASVVTQKSCQSNISSRRLATASICRAPGTFAEGRVDVDFLEAVVIYEQGFEQRCWLRIRCAAGFPDATEGRLIRFLNLLLIFNSFCSGRNLATLNTVLN
jgi:hypothetical protein